MNRSTHTTDDGIQKQPLNEPDILLSDESDIDEGEDPDLFGEENPPPAPTQETKPQPSNQSRPPLTKLPNQPSKYQSQLVDAAHTAHGMYETSIPTITHTFSGQQFVYDPGLYTCQNQEPEFEKSITVHLCLYTINTTSPIHPFLSYALTQTNTEYQFPSFVYSPDTPPQPTNFLEKCKQALFSFLSFVPDANTTPQQVQQISQFKGIYYKGWDGVSSYTHCPPTKVGEEDFPSEDVYVFYVCDEKYTPELSSTAKWATIHELINTKKIGTTIISEKVTDLFTVESDLMYIKDTNGIPIEIPMVLYSIDIQSTNDTPVLLQPTKHKYGFYYMFPAVPDPNLIATNARYIVFTDNCLYLVGTDDENDKMYEYASKEMQFSVIYTSDGQNGYLWGLRSVDGYMLA